MSWLSAFWWRTSQKKRLNKPTDAVDHLLELHNRDPQFMPATDLYEQVLGPFVAGIDTAAVVCSFMSTTSCCGNLICAPKLLPRQMLCLPGGPPTVGALRETRRHPPSRDGDDASPSFDSCTNSTYGEQSL